MMKILYLMHVNWHWIRQRPHVIAELLATRHDVRLMHYAMYRTRHHAAERPPDMTHRVLHRIPGPLLRRVPGLEHLDRRLLALQVRSEARRFKPDCVFVLHPNFEPAVRDLDGVKVVYDCMDDHLAFVGQGTPALDAAEQRLVRRADLTLFSSATLAERVRSRAAVRRFEVVNNGVADSLLQRESLPPRVARAVNDAPVLGYFGTISHWFDWPLVLRLLDALPTAQLQLAGPLETPLPRHPRIHYVGILPHAALAGFVARCDVLLMPFVVSQLIAAVDPVKLYEYVAFGRPALAPHYSESERFLPWVSLYRDADEAVAVLLDLLAAQQDPTSLARRSRFLAGHAWSQRAIQIEALLASFAKVAP